MAFRDGPRILKENDAHIWHDWKMGDYTKTNNTINYSKVDLSKIPKKPGLYLLYENDDLLYVGISQNLRNRIGTHVSCNKHINKAFNPAIIAKHIHRVNRVEFELYPEQDLPWIEMFYICKLKPKYNQ